MSNCQTYERPVLKAVDTVKNTIYLFQPRCKMWSCLSCAHQNRLLWQAKIAHGYEWYTNHGITGWNMLTITSNSKLKTTDQCLHVWKSAWAKLSARMRRKYNGVRYVLLPEHHEDGRVHWHMICSHDVTTRWLKDNAPSCGLGFMSQADKIEDSIKAILYVSKYIGKSIEIAEWPKNLKRISTTQKWPELPPNESYEKVELDWTYLATYPEEGLPYLAEGIAEHSGATVKILGGS